MSKDSFSFKPTGRRLPAIKGGRWIMAIGTIMGLVILALVFNAFGLFTKKPVTVKLILETQISFNFEDAIQTISYYFGVPVPISRALVDFQNPTHDKSNAMNLSPVYHKSLLSRFSIMGADVSDPRANLQAGLGYLAELYKKSGSWKDAVGMWVVGPVNYARGEIPPAVVKLLQTISK